MSGQRRVQITGAGKHQGTMGHREVLRSCGKTITGEGKVYNNELMTGFFLLALITGLLTISYWAGVSEIDELGDEEDFFRDF